MKTKMAGLHLEQARTIVKETRMKARIQRFIQARAILKKPKIFWKERRMIKKEARMTLKELTKKCILAGPHANVHRKNLQYFRSRASIASTMLNKKANLRKRLS